MVKKALVIAIASQILIGSAMAASINVEKRGKGGSCDQDQVNLMGDLGNYVISLPANAVKLSSFEVRDGIFAPVVVDCTAGYCRAPAQANNLVIEYQQGTTLCRINASGLSLATPIKGSDVESPLNALTIAPSREMKPASQADSKPLSVVITPEKKDAPKQKIAPAVEDKDVVVLKTELGFDVRGQQKYKRLVHNLSLVGENKIYLTLAKGQEVVGGLDLNGKSRYLGMVNGKHQFDLSQGRILVKVSDIRGNKADLYLLRSDESIEQPKVKKEIYKERYVLAPNKGSLKEQLSSWIEQDGRYKLLWAGPDKQIVSGDTFSSDLIESLTKFSQLTNFKVKVFEMEKEIEIHAH